MPRGKTVTQTAQIETANKKPYNAYLDVLKGFAILLVVLGHSIQSFASGGQYDSNILFRIIYSFHMPLFMFLSGAAAAYSLRPMNGVFLKRKFSMLVVPFMAWYVLGYFLTGSYHQTHFATYIHAAIVSPDHGLWFLWVLFLNFCCLAFIKKLQPKLGIWAYPIVWLMVYAFPTGKYGIGLVKWHLPFFAAGYLIFLYREQLARFRKVALYLSVASFPILAATWHRLYFPSPVSNLNGHLIAHHLNVLRLGDVLTFNTYAIASMAYTYIVPFAGIGFVYWLFQLKPAQYTWKILSLAGLYTLDIYVVHMYFFRFAMGTSWSAIATGFVIALSCALATGIVILRRVPVLSTILLGGRAAAPKLSFKLPIRFKRIIPLRERPQEA